MFIGAKTLAMISLNVFCIALTFVRSVSIYFAVIVLNFKVVKLHADINVRMSQFNTRPCFSKLSRLPQRVNYITLEVI